MQTSRTSQQQLQELRATVIRATDVKREDISKASSAVKALILNSA
jgi:hypothetical protein